MNNWDWRKQFVISGILLYQISLYMYRVSTVFIKRKTADYTIPVKDTYHETVFGQLLYWLLSTRLFSLLLPRALGEHRQQFPVTPGKQLIKGTTHFMGLGGRRSAWFSILKRHKMEYNFYVISWIMLSLSGRQCYDEVLETKKVWQSLLRHIFVPSVVNEEYKPNQIGFIGTRESSLFYQVF